MSNADLAARILRAITDQPTHYDQSSWLEGVEVLRPTDTLDAGALDCGTTLCVAGFAAHLTGYTLLGAGIPLARKPGRAAASVCDVARDELGLIDSDAAWLFWGARLPEHARAALQQLAQGADTIDRVATGAYPGTTAH
ncbi:hypothetical protein ABZ467_32380 [Streptomyces sp. NPDC005727]|uniref:hypothetical protein n=1 Tax=Streptomyces sp. NPDC005727 TaxID=3157053 RepID=UPI00340144D4